MPNLYYHFLEQNIIVFMLILLSKKRLELFVFFSFNIFSLHKSNVAYFSLKNIVQNGDDKSIFYFPKISQKYDGLGLIFNHSMIYSYYVLDCFDVN